MLKESATPLVIHRVTPRAIPLATIQWTPPVLAVVTINHELEVFWYRLVWKQCSVDVSHGVV